MHSGYFDIVWTFVMLAAFVYFGYHLALYFQPILTTILFAYGVNT